MASDAGAGPRKATVTNTLLGIGAYYVLAGEAVETDVTNGLATTISATCNVTLVLIEVQPRRMDPLCSIRDKSTGRHYQLTTLQNRGTAAAAGSFVVTQSHGYELCVGIMTYYPGDIPGGRYDAPCVTLTSGV
ncbi:MAG TPA: hypothetical protein VM938_08320 [Acidimicrobiales bacterium]|nr:hypothetical protein [Acidimicrobiales bacterium]